MELKVKLYLASIVAFMILIAVISLWPKKNKSEDDKDKKMVMTTMPSQMMPMMPMTTMPAQQ